MVFCINAVVADHFKVPVRDIYDQFDEVNAGDAFRDRFMILMAHNGTSRNPRHRHQSWKWQ